MLSKVFQKKFSVTNAAFLKELKKILKVASFMTPSLFGVSNPLCSGDIFYNIIKVIVFYINLFTGFFHFFVDS